MTMIALNSRPHVRSPKGPPSNETPLSPERAMRICIIHKWCGLLSESFIQAHVERLPAHVEITGVSEPEVGGRAALSRSLFARALRKSSRIIHGLGWDAEITARYVALLRRHRPDVVLAEYGTIGALVASACHDEGIPLVVHFHGHDASTRKVIEEYALGYRSLFHQARAIISVSRSMTGRLIALGAPAEKVVCNPYGTDLGCFRPGMKRSDVPVFVAVGRMVEKKAPHLTILAFHRVRQALPNALLRMIGEGPIMPICRDLVKALKLEDAVTFLGPTPHSAVVEEMRNAKVFVQHSVEADSGDCEGTPVAIIEAGASGLPVVSTIHAGIPDVVIDGSTGFLVPERDVEGMADRMVRLIQDARLAEEMGAAARSRVESYFSLDESIRRLHGILEACLSTSPDLTPFRRHPAFLQIDQACAE